MKNGEIKMQNNQLVYQVHEKLPFGKNLLFALQQYLAIIAATMLVPLLADPSGTHLSQSAALIGAAVGTIIYLICTQFKSPVMLGSSFAFLVPLTTAVSFGYFGILLGAVFSSLVYIILALITKKVGVNWINKIMPPIIIGPTVALIGFDLSASAINNLMNTASDPANYNLLSIFVGIVTFVIVIWVSVKGKKKLKMFPFIVGILGGYIIASFFTIIGLLSETPYLQLIDFGVFAKITDFNNWLPNLTFVGLFTEGASQITSFGDILAIFLLFVPISLVSFAEHIADHKNISSIIGSDLFVTPGLHRTLLGDGLGSFVGALFGGCPNTTYGESIGCVALSKNGSTWTIFTACILCIITAFFYPLVLFVASIPSCVIGGICIALYGFISVSGLRMIKDIDLNNSKNLFVISSIFICGIGGLVLKFQALEIPNIACALIVGIIANIILKDRKRKDNNISAKPELLESSETIPETDSTNQIDTNNEEPNMATDSTDTTTQHRDRRSRKRKIT